MKKNKNIWSDISKVFCIFLLIPYMSVLTASADTNEYEDEEDSIPDEHNVFMEAAQQGEMGKAMELGDADFAKIALQYDRDAGFTAYRSRLAAAEFLTGQMVSQLNSAASRQMAKIGSKLFSEAIEKPRTDSDLLVPAKQFYESNKAVFSRPAKIDNISGEDKTFLTKYYDLKLRNFISEIADAGHALSVAEPQFENTHDYVLVLPLLHTADNDFVNIDILPEWMRQPDQLELLSKNCVRSFGLPRQAMGLAKEAAKRKNEKFSEYDFYCSAADECAGSDTNYAVECLKQAAGIVAGNDPNLEVGLKLRIVKLWLDAGNFTFAANQAKEIFVQFPDNADSGQAAWYYYYALSKSNDSARLLAEIDPAINDKRYESYRARLMYMKWWALRRERTSNEQLAAIEYELLDKYGNDTVVSPVLLSRATDSLAQQDYNGAVKLLEELVAKFPYTPAAEQAKRMLERFKSSKTPR